MIAHLFGSAVLLRISYQLTAGEICPLSNECFLKGWDIVPAAYCYEIRNIDISGYAEASVRFDVIS
jgi:hypothetical protein